MNFGSAYAGEFEVAGVADLGCEHVAGDAMCLTILYSGTVEPGDSTKFEDVMERVATYLASELGKDVLVGKVHFDSPGGDVFEAMRIGHVIRKHLMATQVTKDAKCYSACVLAYLGGVMRLPVGPMGIHSFYSKDVIGTTEFENASQRYNEVSDQIEAYLRYMRVPVSLLDAMKTTPHYNLKVLTFEELERMGVIGIDPVYAQMRR
jgi:hypothetical protein